MSMVAIDGDRILTQVDVRNMYSISSYPVGRLCIVAIRESEVRGGARDEDDWLLYPISPRDTRCNF